MRNVYTGIGSRGTPPEYIIIFEALGEKLASMGYTLRSGGASGADSAFESGCDKVNGKKEIYLPWKNFNGKQGIIVNNKEAAIIAEEFHPNWNNLQVGARMLISRNSCQVLGEDLKTPTGFIVCWTPAGKGTGGTGQALRIAKANNIKVFDGGNYWDPNIFMRDVMEYALRRKKNE